MNDTLLQITNFNLGANPKDALGYKKPNVTLVPSTAILYCAKVMELGAKKYGAYNWRANAVNRTVYLAAAMRHIMQSLDGEELDPESGMPHEASAMACMAIILDALATGNLIDDRPIKGTASKVINDLTIK